MNQSRSVPSLSGQVTIFVQMNISGHTNCHSIFVHKSLVPGWGWLQKLARVIQYIRDTQEITLIIEVDDNPQWWVDRSCDVYPDMKSHMGVIVCMASSKQKFNTTTEAKLVAIDDAMGQILLTRHFISAKGVQTTIYHDNKSKILLSEIGRLSS